jgi:general secretion pathway protein D
LEAQRFQFGNNLQTAPTEELLSDNKVLASEYPKLLVDTAKGFNPATAFLDADGVSAVLSFLNKDTDTEVVATPRAVTLDNQTATLSVTKAFPIFQVTPGSANSPAGATVTYTNLGAILNVTPRIAADNNISLKVVPEVSNIDSVDRQVLNNSVNTANIYAIRRIETSVMIPSGNTLVMGGLVNDTKSKSYVKVPILGDIPFVGLAFRKESKSRNKQNLLIFITPTIVDESDFHASASGRLFMQSRPVESAEPKETAWDSGKPYDWTKPGQ